MSNYSSLFRVSNQDRARDLAIVLVAPQMGENIGSAARVMKNFGFCDLRIVAPRDGWPNQKAVAMSAGGVDIIYSASIYETLEDAISDREFVFATTAVSRDMNKSAILSYDLSIISNKIARSGVNKFAVVFGRESSGLSNQEISLCHKIINIGTDWHYSSLNLAQAICIICYELYKSQIEFCDNRAIDQITIAAQKGKVEGSLLAANTKKDVENENLRPHARYVLPWQSEVSCGRKSIDDPSTRQEIEVFFTRLFDKLEHRKFFKSQGNKDRIIIKLRGIFDKIDNISRKELSLLHGIINLL